MGGTSAPGGEFNLAVDNFNVDPSNQSPVVDQVFGPDGKTLYVAARDGTISVFDMATREETAHWKVGETLGGIDITPDGKTIVAAEQTAALFTEATPSSYQESVAQSYAIDVHTGSIRTSAMATEFGAFSDIATTDTGKAVLVQGSPYDRNTVAYLDLAHGTYSQSDNDEASYLSASRDHRYVLEAVGNISDAPLAVYDSSTGKIIGSVDDIDGYNGGVQAISSEGHLVAQGMYPGQVYIYDLSLNYKFELNSYKALGIMDVAGLSFSPDGKNLYILDAEADTVMSVSTSTWEPVATWAVGGGVLSNSGDGFGDALIASADGHYLSIATSGGVEILDLTAHVSTHAGSAGANAFVGGTGNDTFTINNAGDHITEAANAGYDDAVASVNYTLDANVERLDLTGSATRGDGNNLANTIVGNDLANLLYGHGGNDALDGGAGNDHLVGGAGNDVLDGGIGADTMDGGLGNDRFYVNSASDVVIERAGEGTDTVWSSVHYTLPDNVENLVLTGGAVTGTGNALANTITGNLLDDHLNGMAGNDTLIAGGGGSDVLTGGAGADDFQFVQNDASGASWRSADRITDFSHADGDKIDLKAMDANPGKAGDQAFSFIGSHAFDGHAGELHFVSSGGNTYIEGDLDGDKLTDFVIRLDGHIALVASDFVL